MIHQQSINLFKAARGLGEITRCTVKRFIKTRKAERAEREAQELLDGLFHEVKAQRFKDIVVLQTKFNADPRYMILASSFNIRHLINGTDLINRQYKLELKKGDDNFANISVSDEWNVLDFHSVVVHLLSKKCRERFDIEQLWAVGEKYDDHINFPKRVEDSASGSGTGASARRNSAPITLDGMSIPGSSSG